ncbi:MAG TPA: GspE/PulE family protein [Candidatus Paceibacterota bacterium]|nr:GspE/PulE family protein [Candidatus Paceibacterota bacterium]
MATAPSDTGQNALQEALEKKLADIGRKEAALGADKLATELGLPFADLKGLPIDPGALAKVSESDARAAGVALVQAKGATGVAVTADPRPPQAAHLIEKIKKTIPQLRIVIVSPADMEAVFARYATIKTTEVFEVGAIKMDDAVLSRATEKISSIEDLKAQIAGANVTQLFEILVAGALATKSSDIHFEPEAATVRLRYRLDGMLHEIITLEPATYHRVLNRVKVLSKMKLNITKAPQDGRFTIRQSDLDIEVRVSVLPSEYGESIVMRLLDPRNIRTKLEELGMRPDILEQVRAQVAKPQGALLTTGPTGSGKTTTLYAFINELNTPDVKIITVEDPIEYHIAGISQTQVEPDKGYTFASGLRAIVRQDPDVILIGEIRDLETAEIALNAALTGHLVLSTIHTNDAAGTIPRLIELGTKAEIIAPSLTMAMGQRLLRRLCPDCKKATPLSAADLKAVQAAVTPIAERFKLGSVKDTTVYGPVGCTKCNGTGYKGRVGVYEVFAITKEMEHLILTSPAVSDVRDLAIKQGMVTMQQDSYLKLLDGTTSIEEIRRVVG